MKVFISMPMKWKLPHEIEKEWNKYVTLIKEKHPTAEILESRVTDNENEKPLKRLGKSIEILAEADVAYFCGDWMRARGCLIEYDCVKRYGIPCAEMEGGC